MTKRSPSTLFVTLVAAEVTTATFVYGTVAVHDGAFEPSWFLFAAAASAALWIPAAHFMHRDFLHRRADREAQAERRDVLAQRRRAKAQAAAREDARRQEQAAHLEQVRRFRAEEPTVALPPHAVYGRSPLRNALARDWDAMTDDLKAETT